MRAFQVRRPERQFSVSNGPGPGLRGLRRAPILLGQDHGIGMARRSQKKEELDRIRAAIKRGMDNGLSFEDASIEASKLLPEEYKRRGF